MAKKEPNEEPEEEKNEQFDDEDFGLPDLDYGELEDDEDSEPEPTADAEAKKPASESPAEEEFAIDETELESEIKESSEEPDFYEEESFDEFEENASVSEESDSIFGSDEKEEESYKEVIDTSIPDDPFSVDQDDFSSKTGEPEKYEHKGSFARIVIFGTITFVLIAIALMYFMNGGIFGDESARKKADSEKVVKKEEPKPAAESEKEAQPVAEIPKPKPKPKPTPKPSATSSAKPGTITRLEQSTGKSYIIIASFFDEDLADDHAKALAAKGKSPMIIPPFKDYRFYRVAIAEYQSIKEATAAIGQYKGEYGNEIWPLRY